MPEILERIEEGRVLVADGAMGTMLIEKGMGSGECPESYNITHPEIIEEIASQYVEAGADIIQTNTFGGSTLKLAMYNLEDEVEEINEKAVRAVRRAVGDRGSHVSGSCGPSGRILKPYGDTDPDEMYESFLRQLTALSLAGVDVICIETMVDSAEATLAIKAAKDVSRAIPVMATMTFDLTPKGFFTVMGTSIEKAASELQKAGADVIGSNCGNGIENMIEIAKAFRRSSDLPVIIQSNAGLPEMKKDGLVYRETPELMADKARELIDAGVSIIGGCCGTTPEHIRSLRMMVDNIYHK